MPFISHQINSVANENRTSLLPYPSSRLGLKPTQAINLLTTPFSERASDMQLPSGIEISEQTIAQICEKWGIAKLELFGSALTANFTPQSDIDLLATFDSTNRFGLKIFDAVDDFSRVFNRKVDLVSKQSLLQSLNKFRSKRILASALPIYERS